MEHQMNPHIPLISSARARALRRRQPYNEPLPSTMRWMAMLPSEVRPLALLKQYPRIANLLARTWNDPAQCQEYFDDLLRDRRGHRAGFPLDVLEDLLALRDYYLGRYPQQPREAALAAAH
jgi:hypothetical protein